MGKRPNFVRNASPAKPSQSRARSAPSLPRLRCLDQADADAADAQAGELVSAVGVELHDAITARSQRQKAEWRRARAAAKAEKKQRAKTAQAALLSKGPEPAVELLVPAEAMERPAPAYEPEPPVVSPRIRSAPAARQRIPKSATVVAIDLDHPYRIPVAAERVAPPPGSTLNGHGPAEWQTPPPVMVTVAVAARSDVVGCIYARHQIAKSDFLAARQYQTLNEKAGPLRLRSVDIGMPPTGVRGASGNYGPTDEHLRAAARLKQVHTALTGYVGTMGVSLVTDILARGMTIESAAEARGETDRQEVRFLGSLFRRCLRHLAVALGLATRAAPPRA